MLVMIIGKLLAFVKSHLQICTKPFYLAKGGDKFQS
jgi:hypothetical protein